jgi:hypothetical protein
MAIEKSRPIRFAASLLLVAVAFLPGRHDQAGASGAPSDTLNWLVDRWVASSGGRERLARHRGVHVRARATTGGVPGVSETWVTRDGLRSVLTEDRDRNEWVRDRVTVWLRDWNGRTHALQGRDRADAVTEAFLRALAYVGPSREALRRARATDAGDDSTHTLRRIRLTPPDGVACELMLDRASGRPVRATRWPYDDPVTLAFSDWRDVAGVQMPFQVVTMDREGNPDTTWVTEATPLAAAAVPRFQRPPSGPSDVRFASGDRSLGIPFDFSNDHLMVLGTVNGSRPLWFLIDTGADFNVMNSSRLADMRLTEFGRSTTSGGGGSAGLAFTRVDTLTVGSVTLLGQRAGSLDIASIERIYGMPMGGLLGKDFIDRFTMAVDYDRKVIDLYTPGHDAGVKHGIRVPFIIEEGHPHVRGSIVVDDRPAIPTDWIIDSGAAETCNLTAPFVREHHLLERARRTPAPRPSTVPGTENQFYTQATVRGRLRAISVGGVSVHEVPINLQQGTTGAYASPSFSGTIGQRLLSHFNTVYDYTGSAIYFAPNHATATPFPPRTTFGLTVMSDGPDYTRFNVAGVRKGSPADSVGFRKGDVIAALDGKPASGWRLAAVRAALAEAGSHRAVMVQRAGAPDTTFTFDVRVVSIED